MGALDHDLTRQHAGEPLGERIIVHGRVLDDDGRPVRDTLVEIWQATPPAATSTQVDQHPAPLDPNFTGAGRALTDDEGRYRFITIKPGAYPWGNHHNAWRPAHIHFSLFGPAFATRLVTQMYFPGDPLFDHDPIFHSVRDPQARERLICALRPRHDRQPEWALGYRFDIVLRGPRGDADGALMTLPDALADRRAVLRVSGSRTRAASGWSSPATRTRSASAARSTTATATRSTTRWSRSGRPTATAATAIRRTRARSCRSRTASAASAAAPTDAEGALRVRHRQARPVPHPTRRRRRTSTCRVRPRPAAAPLHADLLPRRGRGQRGRPGAVARSRTRRCARPLIARADDGVLRFDIHLQGERQTAFFDV